MIDHRCARRAERGPRGGSLCSPPTNRARYVVPVDPDDPDKGTQRVCFAHLPRPLWNQETCTHTPRGGDVCPFCGATP